MIYRQPQGRGSSNNNFRTAAARSPQWRWLQDFNKLKRQHDQRANLRRIADAVERIADASGNKGVNRG